MPINQTQKPNFIKNFDGWNKYKKQLEIKKSPLFDKKTRKFLFHQREIWHCSIGVNIGTEICGKNDHFERPVLIIRKSGRHFVALPLTSEKPNNPAFYYDISYENKDKFIVESYILLNPLSLDVLRLQRKIKILSSHKFQETLEKLNSFLIPKNDSPN